LAQGWGLQPSRRVKSSISSFLPPAVMRTFTLLLAVAFGINADADERPVAKVIKLLKDMQSQLEGEKAKDEEVYDKLSCWCDVNGKGKDTAIDSATRKIAELDATIKALTAKASELDSSIKTQSAENAENEQSLASAAELRAKEHGEFQAADKELLLNIDSLKNAIVILGRTHTSFLQGKKMHAEAFVEAQRAVKRVLGAGDDLINQILNPTDKKMIQQFVQAGVNPGSPEYSSKSGEIVGVLKQMLENFKANLSDGDAAETKAQEEFESLKAAKTEEINSGVALVKSKAQSLAKTNAALSEAKEDHSDTTEALTADQKFLMDLKERCANADKEWASRSKTRTLEIQAVSEAISILASDDSHDTFASTFSFVQKMTTDHAAARRAAQRVLAKQAAKSGSAELLAVSTAVQLDAFEKVTAMIEKMVTDLEKEQADEVKHKDYCQEELHQNDKDKFSTENEIEDLGAKINDLASSIDTFKDEISALDASVADMRLQMQRANENRKAENYEFQNVVADQRATQVILKKALDRLQKFYKDQRALIQAGHRAEAAHRGPPPPPGFSPYKTNSGAGGVQTMIQNVITDAANMEATAIKAEQDAEEAYVAFVHNTNDAIAAAAAQKIDKSEAKAQATKDKVQSEADKDAANDKAAGLADLAAKLHSSCDFVMQNFDIRQESRSQEMEALAGAMAALKSS